MNPVPTSDKNTVPHGVKAVGIFLLFGTVAALLAAVTLLWPGTPIDQAWKLNPSAYRQLAPMGWAIGIPFLILGFVMGIAAAGWFMRRLWAWKLSVGIIATQVVGDVVNVFLGHFVSGGVGATIAGALLFYLFRREVKQIFENPESSHGTAV